MTYVPIARGTLLWDVPLNTALTQLDSNTSNVLASSLQAANNLSDLTNVAVARANLQISSGAVAGVNNFNVKDYGALGNGVADDTTSIQNAINAATNGGIIYFPPGNYLLNSSQLTVPNVGTVLRGAGAENTKLTIGASFTGLYAVQITANSCEVTELSFYGTNQSTPSSNPLANAIEITAVRRAKVHKVFFWYINGWCVEATAGGGSSNNPDGTMITNNVFRSSAGGIHFLGNTASGFAVNSFIANNEMMTMGFNANTNANLDCIKIEDSWDLLVDNNLCWTTLGTGASLHIKGNCAASFVKNFDGLGPVTGNCVLVEDSANGSPQNVQIDGGVIQQGLIGMRITGGATNVHIDQIRFINNQTHGLSVEGTGSPVHVNNAFFTQSGAVGSGTNYDINWSGSTSGYITGCRFATTIGTPGVTDTLNFPASAPVRVHNCSFMGTGASSANWYTNQPLGFMEASGGQFNFASTVKFSNTTTAITASSSIAAQPAASGNTILSSNVNASDAFDRMRITGAGDITIGSGAAARDVTLTRAAANVLGLTSTDLQITTAGRGLKVAEGTNAKMGTATANGTTAVTVSTTAVNANSRIYLTAQNPNAGTPGALYVSTITAGTSFQFKSTSGTDASTVAWFIVDHT